MGITKQILSNDANRALEVFSEEFRDAFALQDPDTWASDLGMMVIGDNLKTTMPIPFSAPGFREFKGNMQYRSLFQRSLTFVEKTWQDGVKDDAEKLERDFVGWLDEPANMALEATRAPNEWVKDILIANPVLDYYKDKNTNTQLNVTLFSDSHPVNPLNADLGTFDNNHAAVATMDAAWLKTAKTNFRKVKNPAGRPMGLRLTHLLVPPAREQEALDLLEGEALVYLAKNVAGTENVGGAAVANRHKGTVQLIVCDEFPSDSTFYTVALNQRVYPWVIQRRASVEELVQDKTSGLYKESLQVSISMILRGNAAAALPHGIQRWG
jgi:phage major head subunit gpT-like protein